MSLCKITATKNLFAVAMPACIGAALSLVTALSVSPASAGIFGESADAIVCPLEATSTRPSVLVVFYVDFRSMDGKTFYRPLGQSAIELTVDSNGVIDSPKIAQCHGKSVSDLRDAGRAFEFQ